MEDRASDGGPIWSQRWMACAVAVVMQSSSPMTDRGNNHTIRGAARGCGETTGRIATRVSPLGTVHGGTTPEFPRSGSARGLSADPRHTPRQRAHSRFHRLSMGALTGPLGVMTTTSARLWPSVSPIDCRRARWALAAGSQPAACAAAAASSSTATPDRGRNITYGPAHIPADSGPGKELHTLRPPARGLGKERHDSRGNP